MCKSDDEIQIGSDTRCCETAWISLKPCRGRALKARRATTARRKLVSAGVIRSELRIGFVFVGFSRLFFPVDKVESYMGLVTIGVL